MLKGLWGGIGSILFWLLWPLWVVYFRLGGVRSRVVVIHEEEVLLLESWLGRKKFGLPGGGAKRHESPVAAAVRELKEETGIVVMERSLKRIGFYRYDHYGFKYNARVFSVELSSKPELVLRWPEIFDARWVPIGEAYAMPLDKDAMHGLERYRPAEQASLL